MQYGFLFLRWTAKMAFLDELNSVLEILEEEMVA